MRTPNNYLPGARDLRVLVGESPRFTLLLDEFRQGRATAEELCRVLWPDVDPHAPVPGPGIRGMTPIAWVAAVLDHEAKPCRLGGAGLCEKDGKDYLHVNQTVGERPYRLPRWPTN